MWSVSRRHAMLFWFLRKWTSLIRHLNFNWTWIICHDILFIKFCLFVYFIPFAAAVPIDCCANVKYTLRRISLDDSDLCCDAHYQFVCAIFGTTPTLFTTHRDKFVPLALRITSGKWPKLTRLIKSIVQVLMLIESFFLYSGTANVWSLWARMLHCSTKEGAKEWRQNKLNWKRNDFDWIL